MNFVTSLVAGRCCDEPPILRRLAQLAWERRWMRMLPTTRGRAPLIWPTCLRRPEGVSLRCQKIKNYPKPEYCDNSVPNRLLEQTRLLSWNPGTRRGREGAIEEHIAIESHESLSHLPLRWLCCLVQQGYPSLRHQSATSSHGRRAVTSRDSFRIPLHCCRHTSTTI